MRFFSWIALIVILAARSGWAEPPPVQQAQVLDAAAESAEFENTLALADERAAALRFAEVVDTLAVWADSGDPRIDSRLAHAHMYLAINGRQPDEVDAAEIALAIKYAERAGAQGNGEALNVLYLIHGNGWGTPANPTLALSYLEQAAAAGNDGALLNLAISLYLGNALVARDRDRACELFGDLGDREVLLEIVAYYMGLILYRGECGREADRAGGLELIRMAAAHGNAEAQRDVGKSLEFGWVGEPDLGEALNWYEQAAENGDAYSQWRIGMAWVDGEGRDADPVKAVELFEQSAASGHPNGLTSLAVMFATGDGVERDYARAMELNRQAADLGESHAYRALATMYFRGEGVPIDLVQARLLYLQSIALGSEDLPAYRRELETPMSAEQLTESERQFEAWQAARVEEP